MTKEISYELFEDKDIPWENIFRELASTFGADATINQVALAYSDFVLPKKEFNGLTYVAGYRGKSIISEGERIATLLDVSSLKQEVELKLLFGIADSVNICQYIYQTVRPTSIKDVINWTKSISKTFIMNVIHEKIENTGDIHALVNSSIPTTSEQVAQKPAAVVRVTRIR